MSNFFISKEGKNVLDMLNCWEQFRSVMKEEDDKFVNAKMLVDGQDFIFFFMCRGNIYGANENARSVFAVMKNPIDEPGYEEMSFSATNLSSAMKDDPKEEIFIYKDIEKIKVINKEVARHLLMKRAGKKDIKNHLNRKRSDDGRIKLNKDFEEIDHE